MARISMSHFHIGGIIEKLIVEHRYYQRNFFLEYMKITVGSKCLCFWLAGYTSSVAPEICNPTLLLSCRCRPGWITHITV